ncbi:MAG TPA: ParB N-terminal domain-containing protein [Pseudonocardiaceae bacterium]|jgi:transposase
MTNQSTAEVLDRISAVARADNTPAAWWRGYQRGAQPSVLVPIADLVIGDSPRLRGENNEHVQVLAESDAAAPPIIVRTATMHVVDGHHRLRAARQRGAREIAVCYYDGSAEEAFVLAVLANAAHGLPLSTPDRRNAALRIMISHPEWSDRMIASVTALSPKTVGVIRANSADDVPVLSSRVGRDGRTRPNNILERRRAAGEFLRRNPTASLRQVANVAGLSPTTVQDIRDQLRKDGVLAVPEQKTAQGRKKSVEPQTDHATILHQLRNDPSLRLTQNGRTLLRLFDAHLPILEQWIAIADSLPPHCKGSISEVARDCANMWAGMVGRLSES